MGRGKKRIPKDLQEKLNAHEAKAEIYAQAMLCGDFERTVSSGRASCWR